MALHCTECGFVNGEGANYCQRCGALLQRAEGSGERNRCDRECGQTNRESHKASHRRIGRRHK